MHRFALMWLVYSWNKFFRVGPNISEKFVLGGEPILGGSKLNVTVLVHCKKVLVTLTMFWLPQLHSFCVHDTKFKACLEFEQNVVKQLPSFVKLVSPFRKPYKQHFW